MKKLKISQRAGNIIASPIRKFLPLVQQVEKQGVEIIKLNIGNPNMLPPQSFFKGLQQIKLTDVYYAASAGLDRYVMAWINYFDNYKIKINAENIVPTMGASEAIVFSLNAICDINDEVLVFEPFYTNYKALSQSCGVKLKPITLTMADSYKLPTSKVIKQKITKKTKAIIIINPDNPTGKVWSKNELAEIIKIAKKYKLFIIADETYREMVFKNKQESLLKNKTIKNNLIVVDSVSKRLSMPGIRMGVIVSYNQEVIQAILKLAMARLAISTIGQIITARVMVGSEKYIKKITREYKKRIKILNQAVAKIDGIKTCPADGAFYQVLQLPIKDSQEFIKFLITKFRYQNKTLLLAPMSDFYITPGLGKNEVRVALVTDIKELKEGMEILKRGLDKFKTLNSKL